MYSVNVFILSRFYKSDRDRIRMNVRGIIRKICELSYPPKHVNISRGRFNIIELLDRNDRELVNILDPILEFIEENVDNIDTLELILRGSTYMIEILHDKPLIGIDKLFNRLGNNCDIYVIYDRHMTDIYVTLRRYEETIKILKELLNHGRPNTLGVEYGEIRCSPLVTSRENVRSILQILKRVYAYMDKLSIYVRGVLINVPYETDIENILKIVEEICETCNGLNIMEFTFERVMITEDDKVRTLPRELAYMFIQLLEKYRLPIFKIYPHDTTSGYEISMLGENEVLNKILSEISNIIVMKTFEEEVSNMKKIHILVGIDEKHVEKVRKEYEEYEKKYREELEKMIDEIEEEYLEDEEDEDIFIEE